MSESESASTDNNDVHNFWWQSRLARTLLVKEFTCPYNNDQYAHE